MTPSRDASPERRHDRHERQDRHDAVDDIDALRHALQLEARLLAYEVAITRGTRVIPRSLDEFVGRRVR